MGNESGSSKSSGGKNLSKASWIKFTDKEKQGINAFYQKFVNQKTKEFNQDKLISKIFTYISKEISSNIIKYLNSFYQEIKSQRKVDKLELIDIMTLAHILIKSHLDFDENIYYHKSLILILYDIINGEIYYYEKNKENLDIDLIIKIFNFVILIYFNKYAKKSSTLVINAKELFNNEFNSNIKEFLLCNILNKYKLTQEDFNTKITPDQINEFIDKKLNSLDGFIISYFNTLFLNLENDPNNENMTSFPIFNEPPSTLSITKFFFLLFI